MDYEPRGSTTVLAGGSAAVLTATVITAEGVRSVAAPADLRDLVGTGKFLWVDIVGGDEALRAAFFGELGFPEDDVAWMMRFGQTGRLMINRQRLGAATWISEGLGSDLTEIHVLGSRKCVATIWNGDARTFDDIREHYAERAGELEKNPPEATAILLQLLLGTLHSTIADVDARIQALRTQIREEPNSIDFPTLTQGLERLQSAWSWIDRYSNVVRTAIVGVEAVPDIDARAAARLKDYADQVEDLERRLQERARWGAGILQDYSATIAQRQGDQINRLTIVSLIFLPITFITGFFGMNFAWMSDALGSPLAFAALGLLLPALSVVATVLWFKRRGLM